jgi:hypothetical protein
VVRADVEVVDDALEVGIFADGEDVGAESHFGAIAAPEAGVDRGDAAAAIQLFGERSTHLGEGIDEPVVETVAIVALGAAEIADFEAGHLHGPGAKAGFRPVLRELLPEHDARALDDIFRVGPVRQEREHERLQIGVTLRKQSFELRNVRGSGFASAVGVTGGKSTQTIDS